MRRQLLSGAGGLFGALLLILALQAGPFPLPPADPFFGESPITAPVLLLAPELRP